MLPCVCTSSCTAAAPQEGAVQLLEAGERHLVIMTLPPVDRLPMLQGGPLELIRGWTSRIAERHDTALRQVCGLPCMLLIALQGCIDVQLHGIPHHACARHGHA